MAMNIFGRKKSNEQKAVEALAAGDFDEAHKIEKHLNKDTLEHINEKAMKERENMKERMQKRRLAAKEIGKKAKKTKKMANAFF